VFRDAALSVLIAIVVVVMVRVVVMAAAAYPTTMPDLETWFTTIGP
jgi:hypothetical protein